MKSIPLSVLVEALACLTLLHDADSNRSSGKDYIRCMDAKFELKMALREVMADQAVEVV